MKDDIIEESYYDDIESNKDKVLLIVETIGDRMVITEANLELQDAYNLTIYLVGELSRMTSQPYNQVCNDIKELEDSII